MQNRPPCAKGAVHTGATRHLYVLYHTLFSLHLHLMTRVRWRHALAHPRVLALLVALALFTLPLHFRSPTVWEGGERGRCFGALRQNILARQ